ncbi:hypothetical protein FNV43_RR00262 [Rhamnella rubrinervis]|uniref:Uncharacterized protein n=1 Tax=Rhamnella rubrinervis TaxID=2594499 RepID=A0A8K0HQ11_9ROSA|nr:hypothetical protein FNV43_RR00262 [Rhamnella rubrinervis]
MESSKFSLVLRLLVVVLVLLASLVNGQKLNEFSTSAYLADGDATTPVNYISNLFRPSSTNQIPCGESCVILPCFLLDVLAKIKYAIFNPTISSSSSYGVFKRISGSTPQ